MTSMTESEFRELVFERIEDLMEVQRHVYSTIMALDQRLAEILMQGGKVTGPTVQSANTFSPYTTSTISTATTTSNIIGSPVSYADVVASTQPMLDSQLTAAIEAKAKEVGKTYIEMVTSVRDKGSRT